MATWGAGWMTTLGDGPKKARREKLNDERRKKRLPVRKRRDGAETRKGSRQRVGGRLSCRPPEIECHQALGNCAKPEGLDVWRNLGAQKASSDVKPFPKGAANRGRTLPAGVITGAWLVGQVVKTEESGRVP